MKRKYPALGTVIDVDGKLWVVRDIRDTKHGFDLYFGTPARNHGSYRGGLPRLILTRALDNFWEANCTKHDGILFDLPAGRTTLKRARLRLGFNYHADVAEFWKERIDDLKKLSAREFACKHDVDLGVAFEMRRRLLGRRARRQGWWREPDTTKLLLSDLTLSRISRQLDISISQAHRLRNQAKRTCSEQLDGLCFNKVIGPHDRL